MCEEIAVGEFKITKDTARVYLIRFKNILLARINDEALSKEEENALKVYFDFRDPNDITSEEVARAIDLLERKIS